MMKMNRVRRKKVLKRSIEGGSKKRRKKGKKE